VAAEKVQDYLTVQEDRLVREDHSAPVLPVALADQSDHLLHLDRQHHPCQVNQEHPAALEVRSCLEYLERHLDLRCPADLEDQTAPVPQQPSHPLQACRLAP
jgi:hypothetical protein